MLRKRLLIAVAAAAALFAASLVFGQTRNSATIRGRVVDSSGAGMAEVSVSLVNRATGFERQVRTGQNGEYAFSGLPLTGQYQLSAGKSGFEPASKDSLELRSGETAMADLVLQVQGSHSSVTVYGTVGGVKTDSPELGAALDSQSLEELPLLGRRLSTVALLDSSVRPARGSGDAFLSNTLFVINGGGRRQTTFSLDNSTGDDSWGRQALFTGLPLPAVQEVSVLPNAFSAEYGRTTGSAVNIVTQSGTNELHGEAGVLLRPGGLQANAPLAVARTRDELTQPGASLSGPLFRNRTYFLAAFEHSSEQRDSVITSPLAPGTAFGDYRQTLGFLRLDHRLNGRTSLMARANLDRFYDTNPSDAVGGLSLPSTARTFERRTYSAQLGATTAFDSATVNEARAQFQLGSPISQFVPEFPSTQFVRSGLATEGESRFMSVMNHQYDFSDTLSVAHGRHNWKAGADLVVSSSGGYGQEFGGGYVLGQFRIKPNVTRPIAQLTLADMSSYTQSFGNASYGVREVIAAAFVQDQFQVTPGISLNAGVRYEAQSFTDDFNNVAPRVGFAARLPFRRTTVLRGGYGIYYSEMRANYAAGWDINGPEGIFTFSASPGQFGFPTSLAPLAAFPAGASLPPRDITVRPGAGAYLSRFFDVSLLPRYPDRLTNPYTQQWSFGLETEIASAWVLSVDYVGQHALGLERPLDLNAPAPFVRTAPGQARSVADADRTRPILPVLNGYRRIITYANLGSAYYDALEVNLKKRFTKRLSASVSYTWSHSINTVEPDGTGSAQEANDSNFVQAAEKGTSLLDQRHRVVVSGWYLMPLGISAGTFSTFASGRPFNVTTGVDNNGDGSMADRPFIDGAVIARDAGQGTPCYDLGVFAAREVRLRERMTLTLRAEAFNLLNHSNIVGRNGTWGNGAQPLASFGVPLGGVNNVDPGRQFQFLMRVRF